MSDPADAPLMRMRCRWCSYTVPKFYTGKDGKRRSGWGKLQAHIEVRHEAEAMDLHETARMNDPMGEE